MNPSLPNVDLVFCLKCPILNLTQRLLKGQHVVEGFPQHRLHAGHAVGPMLKDRLEAATFLLGQSPISIYSKENEHIQISAIDVVGGRRSGCRTHRVQNGWKNWKRICGVFGDENERENPYGKL